MKSVLIFNFVYLGKMVSNDSLSIVKKFIVLAEEPDGKVDTYVATMISRPEYLERTDEKDISYLYLGNFTGLIIESKLDGAFRSLTYSENGRIFDTNIVKYGNSVSKASKSLIIGLPIHTKSEGWGTAQVLEEICVVGYRDTYEKPLVGGGGQEERRDDKEKGQKDEEEDQQDEGRESGIGRVFYTIDLSVNNPKLGYIVPICNGTFYKSTPIFIQVKVNVNQGTYFSRWQGFFKGMSDAFSYIVNEDVDDTAILYETTVPCWNSTKNVMNPILGGTSILPSAKFNPGGGLYGSNRRKNGDGTTRGHWGIDISAAVGTPIYAMADGVILDDVSKYNRRYVTEQVNRIKDSKKYPPGYSGNKGDFGNIIYYDCVIDNQEITVGLAHLQEGTPVAINPRTNEPFQPGDEIYQGEIIAYVGRTGNANRGYGSHLHLVTQINGKHTDPAPYLNGNITKVDIYKILGVQCDERDSNGIIY